MKFGYTARAVVKGHNNFVQGVGGSKQRDFEVEPKDAISNAEAEEKRKETEQVKELQEIVNDEGNKKVGKWE